MYKVLIADDEDIICRGLAGMVSEHDRLQVVALAEDGEIAYERAVETQPDLMLVDINMPFLNGLEFIEKIHKVLPDTLIIVVTGYDDFEYVQKALQLGVADYLLKPIMEEPFFEVLNKVIERLDSMDRTKKFQNWVENQMEQNRPTLLNDFFYNWINGQVTEAEAEEQMRYLKFEIPDNYLLTIIHPYKDYNRENLQSNVEQNEELLCLRFCELVEKCFEQYSKIIYFITENDALAVISQVLPQEKWECLKSELEQTMAESFCAKIEIAQIQGSSVKNFPVLFNQVMDIYNDQKQYSELISQVIAIINAQWGNSELSLQSVADSLFVSASYLSRMFHKETGENFAFYLTRKRIHEAQRMLSNTNMKMYEIAQKTGYASQHYFSNAFKKVLGLSPADYRKMFTDKGL